MTATARRKHPDDGLSDAELLDKYPSTLGPGIIGQETYNRVQEIRKRTDNARIGVAIVGEKNGTKPDASGKKAAPALPKPSTHAERPARAVGKMPVLAEEWDGWKRNDMLKLVRQHSLDCKSNATRDDLADLLAAAGIAPPESE